MGGPKTTRIDPNLTAPQSTLRDPSTQFLEAFLKNPSSIMGLLPPTSALQQQTGSAWQNYIGGTNNATAAFNQASPFLKKLLEQTPGQGVLDAATPIFGRNLQLGADTLRQAGPRFNSNTERLVGEQGNKALQDFNLFSSSFAAGGLSQPGTLQQGQPWWQQALGAGSQIAGIYGTIKGAGRQVPPGTGQFPGSTPYRWG